MQLRDKKENNWFDPDKSSLELGVVKSLIYFVLIVVFLSSLSIVFNEGLWGNLQLDADGFSRFVSMFRFPLGVAASSVPIFALLIGNHRSVQRIRAMRLQEEQNIFANHFKHREQFLEFWGDLCERYDFKCSSRILPYRNLFPNSEEGDFSLSGLFDKTQKESYESLDSLYFKATTEGEPKTKVTDEDIYSVLKLYYAIGLPLGLNWVLPEECFESSPKLLDSTLEYFSKVSRFLCEVQEYKTEYGNLLITKQQMEFYDRQNVSVELVDSCFAKVIERIRDHDFLRGEYEELLSNEIILDLDKICIKA